MGLNLSRLKILPMCKSCAIYMSFSVKYLLCKYELKLCIVWLCQRRPEVLLEKHVSRFSVSSKCSVLFNWYQLGRVYHPDIMIVMPNPWGYLIPSSSNVILPPLIYFAWESAPKQKYDLNIVLSIQERVLSACGWRWIILNIFFVSG